MHLGNFSFSLSLLGQRPAPIYGPLRQPERKPLLGREGNNCLCLLLGCSPLSAVLMERGSTAKGKSQAMGMSKLVG